LTAAIIVVIYYTLFVETNASLNRCV
jgi:hypothetical protein